MKTSSGFTLTTEAPSWTVGCRLAAVLANIDGKFPGTTLKTPGFRLKIVPMYRCKYPQTWLYNSGFTLPNVEAPSWTVVSCLAAVQANAAEKCWVLLQLTRLDYVPGFLVKKQAPKNVQTSLLAALPPTVPSTSLLESQLIYTWCKHDTKHLLECWYAT